jgi:hypothetical protein
VLNPLKLTIQIDSDVKKWVAEKGNTITISHYDTLSCCMGYEDVEVTSNTPELKGNYHLLQKDGIKVYVEKTLSFKNNHLQVSFMGFRPFKQLVVEGLKRF